MKLSPPMTTPSQTIDTLLKRPTRADALRNYEALIGAARAAFAEHGGAASLEAIARDAGVGIGTLYRNFPTRQALLEAVYAEEVEAIAQRAVEVADLEPWDALQTWLGHYAGYATTKRAIAEELTAALGNDAHVLSVCRGLLVAAGEPLVARAQASGELRSDVTFIEIARLVGALATARGSDATEREKLIGVALDGLRAR